MIRLNSPHYILFFILVFNFKSVGSAAFYKCKSSSGDITFSDTPCAKTDEVLREKTITRDKLSTIKINDSFVENTELKNSEAVEIRPSSANQNNLLGSKITRALSSLSDLKNTMTEYYNENGKWPEKFDDIKLIEREMNSKYVTRVKLVKDGKLVAYLKKELGNKKILMLQAENVNSMGKKVIEWGCYSNFTSQVLSTLGDSICVSRKIYY